MNFNVWTVLFQIINFVVLLVILRRMLYKPVREIMEKRREAVAQKMRDAERTKSEAQGLKDRYQEEMDGLKNRKTLLLEEMQDAVSAERARLLKKAREEADGVIAREKALLRAEKQTVEAEIKGSVLDSAAVFSKNLLRDVADEPLHEAVVRKFLAGLERTMPEILPVAGGTEHVPIELFTAYPLRSADVDRLRDFVRSRTKREAVVAVTVEAALLAGVRMKVCDQVIDASLAGQIQAMRDKLNEAV